MLLKIYRLIVLQPTKMEFFDYISEEELCIGQIVKVPFGRKTAFGCVWEIPTTSYEGQKKVIQQITNIILPLQILEFIKIFSHYHLCKKQEILKSFLQKMPLKYKIKEPSQQISNKIITLTEEQDKIYQDIATRYNTNNVSLIFGITGSGKTEIYFKLIQDVIHNGGQVLLLLPEIGIISDIRERIVKQLNIVPLLWFSGVKTTGTWSRVLNGDNVLILAARSGIFLPFKNLKLIIIDEEHDTSFKQANHVSYHSRNMSILMAKIWNIPVVLGSATPSTETYYRAINHKYHLYKLHKRFGAAILPEVHFIQESYNVINDICLEQIKNTLANNQQVLIYLNKRGFAGILECIHCHVKQQCQQCDKVLVLHNLRGYMMCHLCGKKYPINVCIKCGMNGLLVHGYGVERLEGFLKNKFPDHQIGIFSSDFCSSPIKIKDFIEQVKTSFYKIIIGTQIIAKGHNFPNLALVIIINTQLQSGDFRGKEVLLQNLLQVSGRAGRHGDKSNVLIQSSDTHLQQWLREENYENFLQKSIEERKLWQLPPFCKLIMIKAQDNNVVKLKKKVEELFKNIKKIIETKKLKIEVFPPSNNPIQKIRNQYRMFILLKTINESYDFLIPLLDKSNNFQIDVNPYEFY